MKLWNKYHTLFELVHSEILQY